MAFFKYSQNLLVLIFYGESTKFQKCVLIFSISIERMTEATLYQPANSKFLRVRECLQGLGKTGGMTPEQI